MKKILLSLFIISIVGCETKTVEVEKSAGIAALYPGDGGDAFVMASTEDAQMAADLILAFADKNVEAMKESFADTAVYWPPLGGKAITTPLSELENKGEIKTSEYMPEASRTVQSEQDDEDLKREMLFKFELLKKSCFTFVFFR